jgi:2-keto-4-pentenoate hydratase
LYQHHSHLFDNQQDDEFMLDSSTVSAAAQRLLAERNNRISRSTMPEAAAGTIDDAYRIQEALYDLLIQQGHGDIAGYKIALTSKAMQQMCGVDHPLAGAILSSLLYRSPARLPIAQFIRLGVEFEVAVKLGADLPAAAGPHTRESVARAVAACMPAFELVEDRNADYKNLEAFSLIADNCWNGGNVLGTPVSDWQRLDLETTPTRLWINGEPAGEGKTGDAMGHPFAVVAWVANLLNQQGKALQRDMIVMTGSSITTRFPNAGDTLKFAIDGMGEIELTLT